MVRSDTGRVVKRHSTREKALAHLRTLKANVEESVLGSLLEGAALQEATLTAKKRAKLPESAFAIPPDRYPINDEKHARNALARVAQHGSPEEQKRVRAAVKRRYPHIGGD